MCCWHNILTEVFEWIFTVYTCWKIFFFYNILKKYIGNVLFMLSSSSSLCLHYYDHYHWPHHCHLCFSLGPLCPITKVIIKDFQYYYYHLLLCSSPTSSSSFLFLLLFTAGVTSNLEYSAGLPHLTHVPPSHLPSWLIVQTDGCLQQPSSTQSWGRQAGRQGRQARRHTGRQADKAIRLTDRTPSPNTSMVGSIHDHSVVGGGYIGAVKMMVVVLLQVVVGVAVLVVVWWCWW